MLCKPPAVIILPFIITSSGQWVKCRSIASQAQTHFTWPTENPPVDTLGLQSLSPTHHAHALQLSTRLPMSDADGAPRMMSPAETNCEELVRAFLSCSKEHLWVL